MNATCLTFGEARFYKEHGLTSAKLQPIKRLAKDAAKDLVAPLRSLSRREQVKVAEALITAFAGVVDGFCTNCKPKKTTKGYPEFNPSQERAADGKWTVGGVAGAAARGAGKLTLAAGKVILRAARNALSTVTLIPSTKKTAGQALKDWWGRVTSKDSSTHIKAVEEAGARVMITILLAAAVAALAHAFIGAAAGVVGAWVGTGLRAVLEDLGR